MKDFGSAERRILALMKPGMGFKVQGRQYIIECSGKPGCKKGEPKTDIYIRARSDQDEREIKISYKKNNADFIENKMSAERAEQIFGPYWKEIIMNATASIREKFEQRTLIYKEKSGRTRKGVITLGWKFELLNKKSGELSEKIDLTNRQVLDVYAGTHLKSEKRDSTVNGTIIPNSGVANYILMDESVSSAQEVIDRAIPIEKYIITFPEIYFACKALNYRSFEKKWDGDRPLCVSVYWRAENGNLVPTLLYDRPLLMRGNEAAGYLLKAMEQLNIKTTEDIE